MHPRVDVRIMHTLRVLAVSACLALFSLPMVSADSILPAAPQAPRQGAPNGVVEDRGDNGAVYYRVFYDQRGKVEHEELDYRHSGRMDTFYYYKDGVLQRVEIDSKGTGKIDIWVYLVDGKYIQRYERDTTGSGKPDVVRNFGIN
jgi:hypothetical protein